MLSAGQIIWASFRPLLRLIICTGFGFGLARADIFPVAAARGAGQIILNVTLPCLMFGKMVPAFNSDNVSTLGPLFLVAILYIIIGIVLAWLVKQIFWVPHRFRHGIIMAGGWGNWGDIPAAVALSICGSAPFDGVEDQTLSVAYVSMFILVFIVTLFPMGGHTLCKADFDGPDVEDDEVRLATQKTRHDLLTGRAFVQTIRALRQCFRTSASKSLDASSDLEMDTKSALPEKEEVKSETAALPAVEYELHAIAHRPQPVRHVSFSPDSQPATAIHSTAVTEGGPSRIPSPTHTSPTLAHSARPTLSRRLALQTLAFLRSLCAPVSSTILLSLVIALVPTLKALFIPVPGVYIHPAPDGAPPLAVLLDTAQFTGGASVPLGLICLGGALARLERPRGRVAWERLPIGAIVTLAIAKTVLMPVLGVLICEGLTNVGVIDREDKVLRFVCIIFSCLPTATSQVYLTQIYSGTGDASHLAAFLLPQYLLMFITMTALTGYALQLLF